jgi:hypothetical protein
MNNFSFKDKEPLFELSNNNKLTLDSKHKEMIGKFKKKNDSQMLKRKIKEIDSIIQAIDKYSLYYKNYISNKSISNVFVNENLYSIKSSNFYIKSSNNEARDYYVDNDESIPEFPRDLINQKDDDDDSENENLNNNDTNVINNEDLTKSIYTNFIKENSNLEKFLKKYKHLQLPALKNNQIKLKNKSRELKSELLKVESNEDENNYYLVNGNIIFKYFSKKNNNSKKKSNEKKNVKKNEKKQLNNECNDIKSFFQKPKISVINKPDDTKKVSGDIQSNKDLDIEILKREALNISNTDYYDTELTTTKLINEEEKNMNEWVSKKVGFNKADMYEKFMANVDDKYNIKPQIDTTYNKCQSCDSVNLKVNSYECYTTCEDCGAMEYVFIDTDKRSYKEPPPENTYFAYKRINHFREWLAQFQAKESTDIPEHVYKIIIGEIKKNRITNMSNLTTNKVRDFLKKHRLNKYYEHIPHIIYKLNGQKPPVIPKEMEEKLCTLFKDIQTPFNKVKPPDRKNFLSYSYVIYKFCQLLELDDLADNFTLLKNKDVLNQQDDIWRKICKVLNWEYIPTIS